MRHHSRLHVYFWWGGLGGRGHHERNVEFLLYISGKKPSVLRLRPGSGTRQFVFYEHIREFYAMVQIFLFPKY